jgi:hypothetical protein
MQLEASPRVAAAVSPETAARSPLHAFLVLICTAAPCFMLQRGWIIVLPQVSRTPMESSHES